MEAPMRFKTVALGCALIIVCSLVVACGEEETPEQRLERLRSRHEIFPVGTTTIRDADGHPTLLVDVQVANQGTEPLSQLTVLIRVRGAGGAERLSQRVTLDMAGVRPGIGERRTALVPGFELAEDDEILVELEANLPIDQLRSLPEYAEMPASGSG
jgi:hypothetical protein